MNRWEKIKSGFVSEKNESLGLITLWITIPLWIAFLVLGFSHIVFEYYLPLFSSTLQNLFIWLIENDYIGTILVFPFFPVCFVGCFIAIYSVFIEPRKEKKWYGVVLIIGIFYVALDLIVLIIARGLDWTTLYSKPFLGVQIFFSLLTLSSFILKFRIWRNERHRKISE